MDHKSFVCGYNFNKIKQHETDIFSNTNNYTLRLRNVYGVHELLRSTNIFIHEMTILMKLDTSHKRPERTPVMTFTDRDVATLECGRLNADSDFSVCYYLETIPAYPELEVFDVEIDGLDLCIRYDDHTVYIDYVQENDEDLYGNPFISLTGLSVQGSGVDVLFSKETVKRIEDKAKELATKLEEL